MKMKMNETKDTRQIGKSDKIWDLRFKALPPGKRISKTGKVYYERRTNRSDISLLKKL